MLLFGLLGPGVPVGWFPPSSLASSLEFGRSSVPPMWRDVADLDMLLPDARAFGGEAVSEPTAVVNARAKSRLSKWPPESSMSVQHDQKASRPPATWLVGEAGGESKAAATGERGSPKKPARARGEGAADATGRAGNNAAKGCAERRSRRNCASSAVMRTSAQSTSRGRAAQSETSGPCC